ncbi:amino acid permease [Selenomonadales bacterium OttesenSCG-928-I06]|nr:amino acid permease [Selenomonadales bacterium OttesenSCG-928-I06]
MKNRHIQMIALGGAIGVGLFLGSATAIKLAGPAVILSYILGGIIVFFLLRALGELTVVDPSPGSFALYAQKLFGSFSGYLTGWTYWSMWVFAVMAEISAIGLYISFWFPDFPPWISALIAAVLLTVVNLVIVEMYGELEFWLALIKVLAIICMIIMGFGIIFIGIGNGGIPLGISNLYIHGGFMPFGIKGVILGLSIAIFSYTGVELIGVAAGEAKDPQKSIPAAINKVFWRILIFYILSMFVILSIYPWNHFGELGSPFVLVLKKLDIYYAAGIMNFIVLTAAFSGCNGGIFSTGRMLYSLAQNNNAPKIFTKVNKNKIPYIGIIFSFCCYLGGVIVNYITPNQAFVYLISITAFAALWTWGTIFALQLKFRKNLSKQETDKLTYKMPFYPYSGIICFSAVIIVGVVMVLNPITKIAIYAGSIWITFLTISYLLKNKIATAKTKTSNN